MRSLCIITHGYPCNSNPIWFPFTRRFAHAAARSGVKVTVIAPVPLHLALTGREPEQATELVEQGQVIEVFRPRYFSTSNRQLWQWNTAQIGLASFCRAAGGILKNHVRPKPDALYGHFLYLGGAAAVRLGCATGIPAFPMVGEGLLNSMDPFGLERARRHFLSARAFMANSTCLARLLQKDLGINREKIGIFPNGIDHSVFYPRDKAALRKKYGLPQDVFLVICVGYQDIQKGPVRVGEAISGLAGVSGVFLGTGAEPPRAENIIFNAPVPYDQVPEWLSAADVFVLPSTYEGCCNASLEAMACGLPVISSTGEFNDDILNDQVAIRIDPLDVAAIRGAIIRLRDDREMRLRMGNAALAWSANFDVVRRARRMLEFMSSRINGECAHGAA